MNDIHRNLHKATIIFVGGIHGVGKGTICSKICEETDFIHITASEILKWNEISEPTNKKVENIQNTQNRLLAGLENVLKRNNNYLLDGHFCLVNSEGQVERVPIVTFEKIAPKLIAVVTTKINLIRERLQKRDDKVYDLALLRLMQTSERDYAQQISSKLNVPFIEIKDGNHESIIQMIQ